MDRREGYAVPRDVRPAEQPDLQALRPRLEARLGQVGTEDHLHLADPRDGIHGEHALDPDAGARLLPGLARGAFLDGLAHLHVPGRERPEAPPRLDGAAAQENPVADG